MENDNNMTTGLPADVTPTSPTTVEDVGSGLSNGSDSVFGTTSPEAECCDDGGVQDSSTLPFTEIGAAYVTPAKGAVFGSMLPKATAVGAPVASGVRAFMEYLDRRQPRPVSIARGTNVLYPFGGERFIANVGASDITALNSLGGVTAAMNALSPGIATPGSYREIANWRRVFDLKNTVISYFNRSIPFTDLEASDRFAIEMCYMRDLGAACLPLLAKDAALALVAFWKKMGYQYDAAKLTNLQSQSAERICKAIYGAIAALPSVDDVFMSRLKEFTRLHLTAKTNGFTPTIMLQDVAVGGPGRYKISGPAGSGYQINTALGALTSPVALNGTTFMEWLELWLRADLYTTDELVDVLNQFLSLAQSLRTNYSIMLACAQQLQLKGSVNYTEVGSFLPVKGVGEYTLDYEVREPAFSYAFKERFEYAPRVVAQEFANGTNAIYRFNLADLPLASASNFSTKLMFRPAGLYKGAKAWGTREVVHIGLFKEATDLGIATQNTFRGAAATALGVTMTQVNAADAATANFVGVDAYFGDMYVGALLHTQKVSSTDTAVSMFRTNAELISYYGMDGSAVCAPFATVSTWVAGGGLIATAPLTIVDGTHILCVANVNPAASQFNGMQLACDIAALLEQLDLTLYFGSVDAVLGQTDQPLFLFTGYRGCEFDQFDLAPVDNVMSNAMYKLVGTMKTNSRRPDAR